MTDKTDLRTLAQAAADARTEYVASNDWGFASPSYCKLNEAEDEFVSAATPAAILALYAEIDRLKAVPGDVEEAIGELRVNFQCDDDETNRFFDEGFDKLRTTIAASRTRAVSEALERAAKVTETMVDVGCQKAAEHCGGHNLDPYDDMVRAIYAAMLAASQEPPT